MKKFECSGCGSCCKRISNAVEATKDIPDLKFPHNIDENGKCEMLLDDLSCMVYENRPLLCNVEKMAEHFKLDKQKFYKFNHKACLDMQDIDNVPENLRLKL